MGAKITKNTLVHKFVNHKFVNKPSFYANLTLQRLKFKSYRLILHMLQ